MSFSQVEEETQARVNEPNKHSAIEQQRLEAWYPLRSTSCVVATFFMVAVTFVVVGICIIIIADNEVVQFSQRYDDKTPNCNPRDRETCEYTLQIPIQTTMRPPIFFYYKFSNYFQNHRVYAQSRSDTQLHGDRPRSLSSCSPLSHWNGKELYPCGSLAQSFLNDTFTDAKVCYPSEVTRLCDDLQGLNWDASGIAWETDIGEKYKYRPLDTDSETDTGPGGYRIPSPANPEMAVWLRVAAAPIFKKLHRRILNTTLHAGTELRVKVTNLYPTASFTKHVVIATTSVLGSSQLFLAWTFIFVGTVLFLLCLLIVCVAYTQPSDREKYFATAINR